MQCATSKITTSLCLGLALNQAHCHFGARARGGGGGRERGKGGNMQREVRV